MTLTLTFELDPVKVNQRAKIRSHFVGKLLLGNTHTSVDQTYYSYIHANVHTYAHITKKKCSAKKRTKNLQKNYRDHHHHQT